MFSVWLTVILTTVLVTFILPEQFVSVTRIKLGPNQPDVRGLADPVRLPTPYDYFLASTEAETIASTIILTNVINQLDLNNLWGKRYYEGTPLKTAETLAILRGRLDVKPVPSTVIIEIKAYDETPTDATQLAGTVADMYKQWRYDQYSHTVNTSLDELEKQLKQHDEKLHAVQKQFAGLKPPAGDGSQPSLDDLKYREKQRELEELLNFRDALLRRIAEIRVDARLPKTMGVIIIESASPNIKPIRPNVEFNVWMSVALGGLLGLLLALWIYFLRRRVYRQHAGLTGAASLPGLRTSIVVTIALIVGIIVGYYCALPMTNYSILIMQILVFFGGVLLAFVVLTKSTPTQGAAGVSQSDSPPRTY